MRQLTRPADARRRPAQRLLAPGRAAVAPCARPGGCAQLEAQTTHAQ
jgi:hypothetical protein